MAFDYKQYFGDIVVAQDLVTRPEERTWRLAAPPRDAEHHDIVLYLGCNVLRTSHMIKTVIAVFERLGLDYIAVGGPTYCCGIVHHQNGDTAASTGMNRRTLEHFQRYTPQEVVMWCPSCIYFYDEVQHLRYHSRGFSRGGWAALAGAGGAAQSRCTGTAWAARLREGGDRRLLAACPASPSWICRQIRASKLQSALMQISDRRLARPYRQNDRALAAGADTLAGMYHGCQRQLCPFEAERPIVLEHYITVFARALGIEFEDTFKKYRLWADPERIFEDSTPCQQANGLDPARARDLIERTFVPLGAVGRNPAVGT
jgi:hypothetical protein